jgi:hypothetical protein
MCPRWRRRGGMRATLTEVHCTNPCTTSTCWRCFLYSSRSGLVPPAGFEPALPPPEAGKTLIIPVSGVSASPFTLVSAS